jgi:hypothetical protein
MMDSMADPTLGAYFLREVRMWHQTHDVREDLTWWESQHEKMYPWFAHKLAVFREALDKEDEEDKYRWAAEDIDALLEGQEQIDPDAVHRMQHLEADEDVRREKLHQANSARAQMRMRPQQAQAFDEITGEIESGVQAKYLVTGGPGTG